MKAPLLLICSYDGMEWSYIDFKGNLINQIAGLEKNLIPTYSCFHLILKSICDFLIVVIVYYLEHEENNAKKFQ